MQPPPASSSPAPTTAPPFDQPPSPDENEWQIGTLSYTKSGLRRLFSWLLWGDFAWAVRDRSLGDVLKFVVKGFGASDAVTGLLSATFPSAIGLFLGPVISYRSDRLRSRWGRRLPFLLVSAPVAAVAILGMGLSPWLGQTLHGWLGVHSPGLNPSTLIVLALWWVAFDFATTVTNSVFGALINDTVPHGVIGRFYALFRMVSLLVGAAFNFYLGAKATEHYQLLFAAVGTIYGVGVVSMCLMVREGGYPPPPPAEEGGRLTSFLLAARTYLRVCFSRPYYLWYFIASNLAAAAITPVNQYAAFFSTSVGMSHDTYFKYIGATYAISLSITYKLGTWVDRFHPLRMSMLAIGLYGVTCLWGGLFATTQGTFGAALLTHGVVSGLYWTASASLGQRLLPKGSFAQFASASGIFGAGINIVLPPTLGYVLDLSGHNYRLTFGLGAVMSLAALGCLAVVHGYWRRLGGPHHYVAPE